MRYTGPKARKSRRLGKNLKLKGARSFSNKDEVAKKPYIPGQHGSPRGFARHSEYAKHMMERQAVRITYGLTEKQMRRVFKAAKNDAHNPTGVAFLSLLERRLDNTVYRAGLANSRNQARQLVNHGHFTVNGKKASTPSITVHEGDVIEVKSSKMKSPFWQNFTLDIPGEKLAWLDKSSFKIKVLSSPTTDDLPDEYNMPYLIEYYSRRVK